MQLKEGSELQNGKYRIIRVLGQGGFGITYLARGARGKHIAIKEFFPSGYCSRNEKTGYVSLSIEMKGPKKKFISEAQKITLLHHKNIVKVIEVFEENGTAYYAMNYIQGEPLADLIRNKSFSVEESIEIIKQVAEAIGHIHSKKMLHLDIKPMNIMIHTSDNVPIVIDFGISKSYDDQGNANTTLFPAASLRYASVEQLNGDVNSFAPQLDIYSLGATFYSTLTGQQPPYPSELTTNRLSFPNNVPIKIIGIVKKAMSYHQIDRYPSIKEFLKDFPSNNKSEKQGDNDKNVSIENTRPIIRSFRVVNKAPYQIGDEIQIRWSIQNAEKVYLNGRLIDDSIKTKTIKYTTSGKKRLILRALNSSGEISKYLFLNVETNLEKGEYKNESVSEKEETRVIIADIIKPEPPVIKYFRRVGAGKIFMGDEASVCWQVNGADSISINGIQVPKDSKIYTLKFPHIGKQVICLIASNSSRTVKDFIHIDVEAKEPEGKAPEILAFMLQNPKEKMFVGDTIKVHWKVKNASSVYCNGNEVSMDGSDTCLIATEPGDMKIKLSACNKFGTTRKVIKVNVKLKEKINRVPVISYFLWNQPDTINVGDKIKVYWKVNNADVVMINGNQMPYKSNEASITVHSSGENKIELTASNCYGTSRRQISFLVKHSKPSNADDNKMAIFFNIIAYIACVGCFIALIIQILEWIGVIN